MADDKTKRPRSVVLAEIKADPEVQKVAELLGMELDEYAEMVMGYVENPDKDPELYVVDEEALAEEGYELDVPSLDDMMAWLKAVESGEISLSPEEIKTTFASMEAAARKKAKAAAGSVTPELAPWMGEEGSGLINAPKGQAGRQISQQIQAEATKARTKGAPSHLRAELERARAKSRQAEEDDEDEDEDEDDAPRGGKGQGKGKGEGEGEGGSLKERLAQLKEAYDAGLLTKPEFARKKAKLLSEF